MALTQEQEQMLIDKYSTTNPLEQVMQVAKHLPQDQAAKIIRYSLVTGDAPTVIANNLHVYEKELVDHISWDDVMQQSPKTYQFLNNPLHMAAVRERKNIEALGDIENSWVSMQDLKEGTKGIGRFFAGFGKGVADFGLALRSNADATYAATHTPEEVEARQNEFGRQFSGDIVKGISSELGKVADDYLSPAAPKRYKYKSQEYTHALLQQVPQYAAQLGLAFINPAASIGFMGTQITGQAYLENTKAGVETSRAFGAALADASIQSVLEYLPIGRILKKMPAGISKSERIREVARDAATEGLTEAIQQYPQDFFALWAKSANMSQEEILKRFNANIGQTTEDALWSGALALPFGGLGAGVKQILHNVDHRRAEGFVQQLEQQQAMIASTPLFKVSPEIFEKHLDEVTDGANLYIDPEAMVLFQSDNPKLVDELGISEHEIDEAVSTGALIEIPISKYNTVAASHPEMQQALREFIADDEDGITMRRVNEQRNIKDIDASMEESAQKESELRRESDRIFQEWIGEGMPKNVARDALTLLVSNAYTQSDNPVQYLRDKAPLVRKQKKGSVPGALHQFAGEKALTADRLNLQEAQRLEATGEDAGAAGAIREKTGWHKGKDGKWRFEISDSQASLIDWAGQLKDMEAQVNKLYRSASRTKDKTKAAELKAKSDEVLAEYTSKQPTKLSRVLDHPALYTAYPSIGNTKIVFSDLPKGNNGAYRPAINTIELSKNLDPEQLKSTLLHEIQHVIQSYEQFAPGGNPTMFDDIDQTDNEIERLQGELDVIINEHPEYKDKIERAWAIEAKEKENRTEAEANELDDIYDEVYNGTGEWGQRLAQKEDEIKLVAETGSVLTAFEQYKRLHGEIEARDTANRAGLSVDERRFTPPESTADAIIVYNGKVHAYSQDMEIPNARGHIHWDDGRAIITLLEGSDASTVVHELVGHYFTQNLLDQGALDTAPEWMKKDRQTVLDYVGIENWDSASADEKRAAHEKMALAAEAYILEGKSPSQALATVFRRFAEWLADVYRQMRRADISVKPEIKAVFDRMLASQEEIEHMELIKDYHRRMPAEIMSTLSEQQVAWLDQSLANVRQKSRDILRGRLLKQFTAEQKEKIQAEIERVKPEIEEATAKEPVYLAMEELRKHAGGRNPRKIADDYLNKRTNSSEDILLDMLAEQFGFTSTDHMMKEITRTKNWENEVKVRIDQHITDTFGDIYERRGQLRQEAEQAMFNEDGATLLAIESQILQEKLGRVLTREEQHKEVIRQRETAANVAQAAIAKLPLSKAMNLKPFITAYRRAAERSRAATIRKDYVRAQQEKEIQLYNHAMIIESLKTRREFERLTRYFKREKSFSKETWNKEEHFVQAGAILKRIGYSLKGYDSSLREESLQQWADRMNEVMDSVSIADWLFYEKEGQIEVRKLKLEQLQDVENALKNIKKIAKTEDNFMVIADNQQIEEVITEAIKQLGGKETVYTPNAEEGKEEAKKGFWRGYLRGSQKITTLLGELDGWKDFGFFHNLIYDHVYKQQNELSNMMHELRNREQAITDEFYSKEEQKEMWVKHYYPELGTSVSKRFLLEMASHTGTATNQHALFGAVPVGLGKSTLWVKKIIGDSESKKIDANASSNRVMTFLENNLTEKDWQWVQAGWDNINTLWPKANAVHKQQTGFSMKKVDATPFTVNLPDGREIELKGGYFPLREDRRARSIAEQRDAASKALYTENAQLFTPRTFTGYTKGRTGAAYSVDLNPANRYRHMQAVAHDIAFRPVITDLRRLITNDEFKGLIERKVGPEGYAAIRDFVAAAATPETKASSVGQKTLDTVANAIRERAIIASLMFNMKTVTQNFANPFLFAGVVDGFSHGDAINAFINRGVFGYWSKLVTDREGFKQDRAFVLEKSAFMRDKLETPDFILHEFQNQVKGEESKIVKWGSMLLAETDNLTNVPMWMEAYEKKLAAGESEADAIRFADTLIDRTTGSGRKIDTASLLRGNSVSRLMTMYQTFINTQANGWMREYGIYMQENDFKRLTAVVGSRFLLFSIASIFLSGDAPDDEKDKYWSEWAYKALSYPMQMLPIAGTLANTALGYTLGVNTFGYRMSPVEGQIDRLVKVFGTLPAVVEGRKGPQALVEAGTSAAAFLTPYPDQFNRWFWNAFDIAFSDMEPGAGDLIRRRPQKER